MPAVNVAPSDPFDRIEGLAIAIAGSEVTGSADRRHLGIFFRPDGGDLCLMHMGWHQLLLNGRPSNKYCWIPCENIDPVVLETVADWLSIIWERNGHNLPYSIQQYDVDPFDANGKLIKCELGEGFTCATFVLWVFHRAQLSLIDKDSWIHRPEDLIWKQWVIDTLYKNCPDAKEHIDAQAELIESEVRFRPEEVAGAAAKYNDSPIHFGQAKILSQSILDQMASLNKI